MRLGRSSWVQKFDRGRHVFFLGATAGLRCAMVCSRSRSCCPRRLSLRLGFCGLDCGRRRGQKSRQAAAGVLSHREHATSSLANSQIGLDFQAKLAFWDLFLSSNFNFINAEIILWGARAHYLSIRPIVFQLKLIFFRDGCFFHL